MSYRVNRENKGKKELSDDAKNNTAFAPVFRACALTDIEQLSRNTPRLS